MKYDPKCVFIITDEYNNLPFYLETDKYVIKTNNVIRFIQKMNEESPPRDFKPEAWMETGFSSRVSIKIRLMFLFNWEYKN